MSNSVANSLVLQIARDVSYKADIAFDFLVYFLLINEYTLWQWQKTTLSWLGHGIRSVANAHILILKLMRLL